MSKKLPKAERVIPVPLGLTSRQIYVLDHIAQLKSTEARWPVRRSEVARLLIDIDAERCDIIRDEAY